MVQILDRLRCVSRVRKPKQVVTEQRQISDNAGKLRIVAAGFYADTTHC